MEAYIEYVIIDNFAVDLLIMLIVFNLLRYKVYKLRMLLSVIVGTLGAVIMPIVPISVAVIIRIALPPLMCVISRKYISVKQYMLTLIVMLLVTFAIGGTIIAVFNMTLREGFYIYSYPVGGIIGLTALGLIVTFYGLKQFIIQIRVSSLHKKLYSVLLFINGKPFRCKAFYDSGNNLYDSKMQPVIVLSNLLSNKVCGIRNGEDIEVNTVNGIKVAKTYIIEKLMIYINGQVNTIYNTSSIVSETDFHNFDLLLHSEMLKEG